MKKQYCLTITLFFVINLLLGQTTKPVEARCVLQFDSLLTRLDYDKIVFKKNNDLDTLKSKLYLDSINWFMARHPKARILIKLKKANNSQYCATDLGQKQAEQIGRYLIHNGANYYRLAINGTHCAGQFMITDEDLKTKPRFSYKLSTIVMILAFDYVDR